MVARRWTQGGGVDCRDAAQEANILGVNWTLPPRPPHPKPKPLWPEGSASINTNNNVFAMTFIENVKIGTYKKQQTTSKCIENMVLLICEAGVGWTP